MRLRRGLLFGPYSTVSLVFMCVWRSVLFCCFCYEAVYSMMGCVWSLESVIRRMLLCLFFSYHILHFLHTYTHYTEFFCSSTYLNLNRSLLNVAVQGLLCGKKYLPWHY